MASIMTFTSNVHMTLQYSCTKSVVTHMTSSMTCLWCAVAVAVVVVVIVVVMINGRMWQSFVKCARNVCI